MDEFTIYLGPGVVVGTNNFETVESLREAIKESFAGRGAFKDGLWINWKPPGTTKVGDYQCVINPIHVQMIVDNRINGKGEEE